jgi:4'-phosphopantetheinyl transferase
LKVQVYFAKALNLLDSFARAFALLPPARKAKCLAYRKEEDRLRSMCAGLLMRRYLNVTKDEDIIIRPSGRPELASGHPIFSLSHSGALCAIAIAEDNLGLDLEHLGRKTGGGSLAHKVLTPMEYKIFTQRLDDPEFFFSIWTRKESVMKATGQGLAMDPGNFSVIPLAKSDHFIQGKTWYFQTFEVSHHIFSICAEHGPLDINLMEATNQALLDP